MGYTDKELKDATQVVYLNLLEKTLANFKADGDTKSHSLREIIMANINIESVKKNLKFEKIENEGVINEAAIEDMVKNMPIQELAKYAEIKDSDKDIISKLPDEAMDWKIPYLEDRNNDNGFYCCVIETSEESAIVAFRGSEGWETYTGAINDWAKADFGLLKNECTSQQKSVEEFLDNLKNAGILDKYNSISATGHSLGGNLASHFAVSLANDDKYKDIFDKFDKTVNFDGPGVSYEYLKKYKTAIEKVSGKINHYTWSAIGNALNYLPGENIEVLQIDEDQHKDSLGDQIWYKTLYRHHTNSIMFSKSGKAIRGDKDELSKAIHPLSIGVDIVPEIWQVKWQEVVS